MKRFFTLFIILLSINLADAQRLVDMELKASLPASSVSALIGGLSVPYGVDLYKVRYMTPDTEGNDHIASGLLCIPNDPTFTYPMAIYQHGTVADRDDVPSNLMGGFQLAMVFSAFGYVVCAPDYIGLGDSPGVHPYVHAQTEASAAIDMLRVARELDDDDSFAGLALNDQLFISGYSQGGHAAMAAHRELETNLSNEFTVTAAAPMSGPYSISEKMIDFTLGEEEYGTVAYLAWSNIGFKRAYPELLKDFELEDVFKAEYLGDILEFESEAIDLWELNDRLIATLVATVGSSVPKNMLKDEVLNSILTDPDYPLSVALADNDTYDWAPQAPTNLYYCEGDDQVTFENAILASQVMNDNGAAEVNAVRLDKDASPEDHGGCVFPAALSAVSFFGTFQELLSSNEAVSFDPNSKVYYANNHLNVNIPNERTGDYNLITIYNQTGMKVWEQIAQKGLSSYNIGHLTDGMYVVTLRDSDQLYKTEKLIKF